MAGLVVFLNELSCRFEGIHRNVWANHIQTAIRATRSVRQIRADMLVALECAPSAIFVGVGEQQLPLAAVIGGGRFEDEWGLLRDIFQTYPSASCPESYRPGALECVQWNEIVTEGMSWAYKAKSFVLSFGYPPYWHDREISAAVNSPQGEANANVAVTIRNIASSEHVGQWRAEIEDFGVDFSVSSLIYENDEFAVRMYLNDHNPPHVHVFRTAQSRELIARINIRTAELMEGTRAVLPIRARLVEWTRKEIDALARNWGRCRAGQLPERLAD